MAGNGNYGRASGQQQYANVNQILPPRMADLLDGLRSECENAFQGLAAYKLQREEMEHKLTLQLNDMHLIQKNYFELERTFLRMKAQFEEEVTRLRRDLDIARGGSGQVAPFRGFPIPESLQLSLINSPKRSLEKSSDPTEALRPTKMSREDSGTPHVIARRQNDESVVALGAKKDGGYDWLVVYNPKATRALGVELLHSLPHDGVVCCVRFSPDGKLLATGGNRACALYDVQSGNRISTLWDPLAAVEGDLYIRSVLFTFDSKSLIAGAEDRIIRIWDVATGELKARLSGHEQDIYALELTPSGKELASGSGDRTVRLWDLESGSCTRVFTAGPPEARDSGITSVTISSCGNFLAAGALDRLIRIWDLNDGRLIETLEGHRDSVYSVAFSPDGKLLVSGSLDKTLKIWEFFGSKDSFVESSADKPNSPRSRTHCKYTVVGHKDFVLSVACSLDGRWVISGSKDRTIQFWDPQNSCTQLMLQGHKNSVISVALSPKGQLFATGSGDCRARIWSYTTINNSSPPNHPEPNGVNKANAHQDKHSSSTTTTSPSTETASVTSPAAATQS